MKDNESNLFDSASHRREFLRTYRENLQIERPDLDQIEDELRERNPAILHDLNRLLERHYPDETDRAEARRVGLQLLHLVYAQGDIEEFERKLTIVDGGGEDLPPSA